MNFSDVINSSAPEDCFRQYVMPATFNIETLFDRRDHIDFHFSYFEKASESFALCGIGIGEIFELGCGEEISSLEHRVREALSAPVVRPTQEMSTLTEPTVLGGFRFNKNTDPDEIWEDFGYGHMILPKILFTKRLLNQDSGEIVTFLTVSPGVSSFEAISILTQLQKPNALSCGDNSKSMAVVNTDVDNDAWRSSVNAISKGVRKNQYRKAVLATRKTLTGKFKVASVLESLRSSYPECFLFCFSIPRDERGVLSFLGATPELLVSLDGKSIKSLALAGSIGRGTDRPTDTEKALTLTRSQKDIAEHDEVIMEISNRLRSLTDSVIVEQTRLRRLNNIQHLSTAITAQAETDSSLLKLVEVLHPTPAVCGAPREIAWGVIGEHEKFDRGWYAAPIGWIDSRGRGEFAVALRSALVEEGKAWLFAGNGIVGQSKPDIELHEVNLKFKPLSDALGGTQDGH
ncbi:MAG: isochorismate synthase [Dehalococcoidia bacterium]|nr:isochorismate synthase [Dehalococcoidia bacterium]